MHPEQQRAVLLPAPRLLPEFSWLHGRHQQLERPCAVHLLADHLLDLAQNAQAERHPGEQARREAPDQAGPKHELMADDLCFRRNFLERRKTEFGIAHV